MREEAEHTRSTQAHRNVPSAGGGAIFYLITQPTPHYLANPLLLTIVVVDSMSLKEEASMNILAKESLTNPQVLILSNF